MSFKASWISAKTADLDKTLDRLNLVRTGAVDVFGDAPMTCAQMGDWAIVLIDDYGFVTPEAMTAASGDDTEAVGCQAYDVVMCSDAVGYHDGEQTWSVSHDPDHYEPLEITGAPPKALEAVRQRWGQKQDADESGAVDYIFDVPLELAQTVCGFRPDDGPLSPQTVFHAVERRRPGAGGVEQANKRARNEALQAKIESELYPVVRQMGFAPLADHPEFHGFYPRGAPTSFVRYRGLRSESLLFVWGFDGDHPTIQVHFIVRHGAERRPDARAGIAAVNAPETGLFKRLFSGKQPARTVDEVVAEMRGVLVEMDAHLKTGAQSDRVVPARYQDDIAFD